MDEHKQALTLQRRRSEAEIARVVAEYEASGLSRVDFCRQNGLSLATLARYRKRQAQGDGAPESRWLAVEIAGSSAELQTKASSGLTVGLAHGRRIEIGRGFDARTLAQLVVVLERI